MTLLKNNQYILESACAYANKVHAQYSGYVTQELGNQGISRQEFLDRYKNFNIFKKLYYYFFSRKVKAVLFSEEIVSQVKVARNEFKHQPVILIEALASSVNSLTSCFSIFTWRNYREGRTLGKEISEKTRKVCEKLHSFDDVLVRFQTEIQLLRHDGFRFKWRSSNDRMTKLMLKKISKEIGMSPKSIITIAANKSSFSEKSVIDHQSFGWCGRHNFNNVKAYVKEREIAYMLLFESLARSIASQPAEKKDRNARLKLPTFMMHLRNYLLISDAQQMHLDKSNLRKVLQNFCDYYLYVAKKIKNEIKKKPVMEETLKDEGCPWYFAPPKSYNELWLEHYSQVKKMASGSFEKNHWVNTHEQVLVELWDCFDNYYKNYRQFRKDYYYNVLFPPANKYACSIHSRIEAAIRCMHDVQYMGEASSTSETIRALLNHLNQLLSSPKELQLLYALHEDANSVETPEIIAAKKLLNLEEAEEITSKKIKSSYRKIMLNVHPDKIKPGEAGGQYTAEEINAAKALLDACVTDDTREDADIITFARKVGEYYKQLHESETYLISDQRLYDSYKDEKKDPFCAEGESFQDDYKHFCEAFCDMLLKFSEYHLKYAEDFTDELDTIRRYYESKDATVQEKISNTVNVLKAMKAKRKYVALMCESYIEPAEHFLKHMMRYTAEFETIEERVRYSHYDNSNESESSEASEDNGDNNNNNNNIEMPVGDGNRESKVPGF